MKRTIDEIYILINHKKEDIEKEKKITLTLISSEDIVSNCIGMIERHKLNGKIEAYEEIIKLIETSEVLEDE